MCYTICLVEETHSCVPDVRINELLELYSSPIFETLRQAWEMPLNNALGRDCFIFHECTRHIRKM